MTHALTQVLLVLLADLRTVLAWLFQQRDPRTNASVTLTGRTRPVNSRVVYVRTIVWDFPALQVITRSRSPLACS
jgi:hypothetical protein